MDLSEAFAINVTKRFNPAQPRDANGRWAKVFAQSMQVPEVVNQNIRQGHIRARESRLEEMFAGDPILQRAKDKLANLARNSRVNIRMRDPDTLMKILDDGRFKSQFETSASGGYFGPGVRADVESRLFNIPNAVDHAPDQRPIYGFLVDAKADREEVQDVASGYGRIRVVLNESATQRATMTGSDSLGIDSEHEPDFVPSPVTNPSVASMMYSTLMRKSSDDRSNVARKDDARGALQSIIDSKQIQDFGGIYGYVEAQIHGQVKASDIVAVYIWPSHYDRRPDLVQRLKGLGIDVIRDERKS